MVRIIVQFIIIVKIFACGCFSTNAGARIPKLTYIFGVSYFYHTPQIEVHIEKQLPWKSGRRVSAAQGGGEVEVGVKISFYVNVRNTDHQSNILSVF